MKINTIKNKTESSLPELKSVMIRNLRGHSYDLNFDKGINVLKGANGSGKTTIFKLIECVLNPGKSLLHYMLVPEFDSIYCVMSDGMEYGVEKEFEKLKSKKEFDSSSDYMEYLTDSRHFRFEYVIRNVDGKEERLDLFKLFKLDPVDSIDEIKKIIADELKYADEEYVYRMIEDIYDSYNPEYIIEATPYPLQYYHKSVDDEKLKYERNHKIEEYLMNYFLAKNSTGAYGRCFTHITDDRIYKREKSAKKEFESGEYYDDRCEEQCYILSGLITERARKLRKAYTEKTDKVKDSFAGMYLNREEKEYPEDEIKREWEEIRKKYQELTEIGLLSEIPELFVSEELKKVSARDNKFVKVYMDAFKEALCVYEGEYEWYKLLYDMYGRRNGSKGREIRYCSHGVEIASDGDLLDLDHLSPGEKSEMIMLMSLIFNTANGGVVLIDEPELSLDEEGLKIFMENLKEITEKKDLQVILATKSPVVKGDAFIFLDGESKGTAGHFELAEEFGTSLNV